MEDQQDESASFRRINAQLDAIERRERETPENSVWPAVIGWLTPHKFFSWPLGKKLLYLLGLGFVMALATALVFVGEGLTRR